MSKKVKSTIKKFPGHVLLHDPLTFPMVRAFEVAIAKHTALVAELGEITQAQSDEIMLPAICVCVEEWHLEGQGDLTPETFPATPRAAASRLVAWLTGDIVSLYSEDEEVPNE